MGLVHGAPGVSLPVVVLEQKQLKIGVVVAEQRFRTYSVLLKFSHGPDVVDGGVRQGHVRARLLCIPVLALALEMVEDRKPRVCSQVAQIGLRSPHPEPLQGAAYRLLDSVAQVIITMAGWTQGHPVLLAFRLFEGLKIRLACI